METDELIGKQEETKEINLYQMKWNQLYAKHTK